MTQRESLLVAATLTLLLPQVALLRLVGRRGRLEVRLVAGAVGLAAAAGGALLAAFWALDLGLEQDGAWLWAAVAPLACGIGVWAARRARRLPAAELAAAALPVLQGSGALALWRGGGEGLASAPLRAWLLAPAVLGLCGYFGAATGYLLWGGRRADWRLGYEAAVGRRFLLSRASPVLSTVTTISVIGVALGVWLVLVSLGILGGFESDLQRKIIGANAHVVLQAEDGLPRALPAAVPAAVAAVPGVRAVAPFVEGEVAVASQANYTGALLFGIDPGRSPAVLTVLDELTEGSLSPLAAEMAPRPPPAAVAAAAAALLPAADVAPAAPAGIVLGVEMARGLGVKVGDRVRVISPLLDVLTPVGPAAKSLGFVVAAVFTSKMYEYDARYAFVALPAARRFFELDDDAVSGLQLRCDDPAVTAQVGAAAATAASAAAPGLQLTPTDWRRRNQTLFSALKLERVVAFVVLVFIILVASFSIVNTLTMSVLEKRREIAILKTMGAPDVGIMKIFLTQGLLVGAFGIGLGAAAGVGTMALLDAFGFWIPGDVYYIDSLPVKLDATDVAVVVCAALLIVWDFAVFPALQGAQLAPVEGLRDG